MKLLPDLTFDPNLTNFEIYLFSDPVDYKHKKIYNFQNKKYMSYQKPQLLQKCFNGKKFFDRECRETFTFKFAIPFAAYMKLAIRIITFIALTGNAQEDLIYIE